MARNLKNMREDDWEDGRGPVLSRLQPFSPVRRLIRRVIIGTQLPMVRDDLSQKQEDAMSVAQTAESVDLAPAMHIVEEMSPVTSGDIIPLLQRIQEAYGYLPRDVVLRVCEETDLPASRVFGVATFYSQFSLQPQGRHLVRCCKGTACHVRGGQRVMDTIQRTLGISDGETTSDMAFSLETVACLGTCFLAPVLTVNDTYYGQVTPDRLKKVLAQYE